MASTPTTTITELKKHVEQRETSTEDLSTVEREGLRNPLSSERGEQAILKTNDLYREESLDSQSRVLQYQQNIRANLTKFENARRKFDLAVKYEKGIEYKQNIELAMRLYKESALDNYPEALFIYGKRILQGYYNLDQSVGIMYIHQAADYDRVEAQLFMAATYEKGMYGTPKNKERAIRWYQKAAEHGDEQAKNILKRLSNPTFYQEIQELLEMSHENVNFRFMTSLFKFLDKFNTSSREIWKSDKSNLSFSDYQKVLQSLNLIWIELGSPSQKLIDNHAYLFEQNEILKKLELLPHNISCVSEEFAKLILGRFTTSNDGINHFLIPTEEKGELLFLGRSVQIHKYKIKITEKGLECQDQIFTSYYEMISYFMNDIMLKDAKELSSLQVTMNNYWEKYDISSFETSTHKHRTDLIPPHLAFRFQFDTMEHHLKECIKQAFQNRYNAKTISELEFMLANQTYKIFPFVPAKMLNQFIETMKEKFGISFTWYRTLFGREKYVHIKKTYDNKIKATSVGVNFQRYLDAYENSKMSAAIYCRDRLSLPWEHHSLSEIIPELIKERILELKKLVNHEQEKIDSKSGIERKLILDNAPSESNKSYLISFKPDNLPKTESTASQASIEKENDATTTLRSSSTLNTVCKSFVLSSG